MSPHLDGQAGEGHISFASRPQGDSRQDDAFRKEETLVGRGIGYVPVHNVAGGSGSRRATVPFGDPDDCDSRFDSDCAGHSRRGFTRCRTICWLC
jgi:hypothetical protein